MRLNHPGIYRIVGEEYELLANITGEVPCLKINSALLMNSLVRKGKFEVLTEDSLEVQKVLTFPDAFIFIEYEYSEVCKLPEHRKSIRGSKMPKIDDKEFNSFVDRYIEDTQITGRGVAATKSYIMYKTGWSLAQINVLILKIAKKVKQDSLCASMQIKSTIIYTQGGESCTQNFQYLNGILFYA